MGRLAQADAVLKAAEEWKRECLLGGGSVFSEERLWTLDNFRDLHTHFVDNAHSVDDKLPEKSSFEVKLEYLLKPALPEAKRLWSEMTWAYFLISSNLKRGTKLAYVETVWGWSGTPLPADSPALGEVLDRGVIHPGTAYSTGKWREFVFFIKVMINWFSRSAEDRKVLLSDAWRFAEWLDGREESDRRQLRHVFLFLLFPDSFEAISTESHKRKIVEAYHRKWGTSSGIDGGASCAVVDRALLGVRERLEQEHPGQEIHFYQSPFRDAWRNDEPGPGDRRRVGGLTRETPPARDEKRSLNTILYGPPGTGKTWATARRCVEICDGSGQRTDADARLRYDALVEEERVAFVTFHESYGYEEFVEGLRPETDGGMGFRLEPVPGALKRIATRARANTAPHVLVIDEINRANVSKVLGELVTLLEEDKRAGAENAVSVVLPYSGERFTLPANLHVLGTMNTADRSIALLDTAVRRRFDFEELAPTPGALEEAAGRTGVDLPAVLGAVNRRLEWLIDRDHLIGHAWLMGAASKSDVDNIMRRKIVPLIAEYFHDDWRKVRAVLGGGEDFVRGEPLSPPPGVEADTGETRFRWSAVEPPYADSAYARLVSGAPPQGGMAEDG